VVAFVLMEVDSKQPACENVRTPNLVLDSYTVIDCISCTLRK